MIYDRSTQRSLWARSLPQPGPAHFTSPLPKTLRMQRATATHPSSGRSQPWNLCISHTGPVLLPCKSLCRKKCQEPTGPAWSIFLEYQFFWKSWWIGQWFSECGPPTISNCITWQLGGNAGSQAPPNTPEPESLGLGSSDLCLQAPRWSWSAIKFAKEYYIKQSIMQQNGQFAPVFKISHLRGQA